MKFLSSILSALGGMKLYKLMIGSVVFIFLSSAIYREYSWSSSNFKLKTRILGYEKDIESLKLQLLIDELIDYKCDIKFHDNNHCISKPHSDDGAAVDTKIFIEKIDEFSISAFQEKLSKIVTSTSDAINIKLVDLKVIMKPYILNWSGLFTLFLCVLVMLIEIFKAHSSTVFSSQTPLENKNVDNSGHADEPKWSNANKYFETYVAKRKILSNAVMFFVMFFLALLSWFNVIPRAVIVSFMFKFLILWTIAIYLSFFLFNYVRIRKYFPKERIELWKCLRKGSWWLWLLPRIFTSEGFLHANFAKQDNGTFAAVFSLIGSILRDFACFLPYYYFYFYSDYFYGKQTEVQFAEYTRIRNIFLTNMAMQLALAMSLYYSFTLLALGSPVWIKKRLRAVCDAESEGGVQIFIVILIGNTAVCCLRVIWYFFVGNSTWLASFLTLFFLLHHVVGFIAANAVSTTILEKCIARNALIEPFVRTFIGNHIMKNSTYYEGAECPFKTDEEVVDAVAVLFVDLFEALLDKTARGYICGHGKYTFVSSLHPDTETGPKSPKPLGGSEEEKANFMDDNKSKTHFYRAFETSYLNYFPTIIEENEAAEMEYDRVEKEEKEKEELRKSQGVEKESVLPSVSDEEDDENSPFTPTSEMNSEKAITGVGKSASKCTVAGGDDSGGKEAEKGDGISLKKEENGTNADLKGTEKGEGEEKEAKTVSAGVKSEPTPLENSRIYFEDLLGVRL